MAKKNLLMLSAFIFLAGCASVHHGAPQTQEYIAKSKTVPATKLPPSSTTNMKSYYPIPPVSAVSNSAQPTNIIPPGSQLSMNKQTQPAAEAAKPAANTVAPTPVASAPTVVASSSSALVVNAPFAQAWEKVGRGLKASGYKVMQQDKGMGAYYILDVQGSGGVLKTNTPIYRVNVKSTGSNTSVTLVDGQNNPVNASTSSRILGALKQKI